MPYDALFAWVTDVARIAAGIAAILGLIGLLDRGLNGRLRNLVAWWLGVKDLQDTANTNSDKLDRLHEDHLETMGAQVAVAQHTQELGDIVCDEMDIPESGRPDDLRIGELQARANSRGASWPGEFTRGGGGSRD